MKRVILSALAAGIFATAAAQEELTLRKCLEIGLENNYDIRIVRNGERISDNNATAANAGMVPTIDFEAGYSGALDNERTTPREGDAWSDNGIYDQTFNAGINLNWTIFDGFRIRTNYKKLKEMQEMGTVRTRITIEDFVATHPWMHFLARREDTRSCTSVCLTLDLPPEQVKRIAQLLETEGVAVEFADDGIRRMAEIAYQVNEKTENIGARRLHTVMEKLLEEVSFEAGKIGLDKVAVDAAYVNEKLGEVAADEDLSRYVL